MGERISVKCISCKWRGRRIAGECSCYDEWAMYCHCTWGYCPKCKRPVHPVIDIQMWDEQIKLIATL
jgi:hypothetical protein